MATSEFFFFILTLTSKVITVSTLNTADHYRLSVLIYEADPMGFVLSKIQDDKPNQFFLNEPAPQFSQGGLIRTEMIKEEWLEFVAMAIEDALHNKK